MTLLLNTALYASVKVQYGYTVQVSDTMMFNSSTNAH
jgi:hypothetical protein